MAAASTVPSAGRETFWRSDLRLWRLSAWSAYVYVFGVVLGGIVLARFVPPPRENWTAEHTAEFFRDHEIGVRAGMEVVLAVYMLYAIFSLGVAQLMKHIEPDGGFLHRIQLLGGVLTAIITMLCATFWLLASFRADSRSPEDIQLLNDTGWMIFDITIMATIVQFVAFGAACLIDDGRRAPLVPRWLGYLSFFFAFTYLSEFFMPSLQTGPFSWQGLLSLYVAMATFGVWISLVALYMLRAVKTVENEQAAP
ncbi:hypothetical protein APR12_005576 [Nocardia amikacinitolerans]|uniref:hypothetical protein n=1 Tax=Nocardia amikacinitolerans TaxID=756689 RepID=UPI000A982C67|nr:hypothetical protein [Nocardia amikacinitolerans]MCP2320195.1 hypothetical protein [Nocardia amikacinitolerans]